MQRIGQVLVATVTATGACLGGAAAIGSVMGVSPLSIVTASPATTLEAFAAVSSNLTQSGKASPASWNDAGGAPAADATSGASGASNSAAPSGSATVATAKATAHATSGASGASAPKSATAKKVTATAHAKSGASGATGSANGGAKGEGGENDD